jgi:sugar phosphate permease
MSEYIPRAGIMRWVLGIIIVFDYALNYFDRITLSATAPVWYKEIGLDPVTYGIATSLMFVGYGVMQILGGYLADRVSARLMSFIATLGFGIATLWMGLWVYTPTDYMIRNLAWGFFLGCEWAPMARMLVRWSPKEERARLQSIMPLSWLITPMVFSLLAPGWALGIGWRTLFVYVSLICFVEMVIVWFLMRDQPEQYPWISLEEVLWVYHDEIEHGLLTKEEVEEAWKKRKKLKIRRLVVERGGILPGFKDIVKNKWLYVVIMFSMGGLACYWIAATWWPMYITKRWGLGPIETGYVLATFYAGGIGGTLIPSWISDKIKSRKKPSIISALISLIGALWLVKIEFIGGTLIEFCLGSFLLNWGCQVTWAILPGWVGEIFSPENAGTVTGIYNGIGYWWNWASSTIAGLLVYKVDGVLHWELAIAWILHAPILLIIATLLLREGYRVAEVAERKAS